MTKRARWEMEKDSTNMFEGFGDNFIEEYVDSAPNQQEDTNFPSKYENNGGGSLDILQQSLQAAEIIGSGNIFDDFNFPAPAIEPTANHASAQQQPTPAARKDDTHDAFDTSQFFNVPAGAKPAQSPDRARSVTRQNLSNFNRPSGDSHHAPSDCAATGNHLKLSNGLLTYDTKHVASPAADNIKPTASGNENGIVQYARFNHAINSTPGGARAGTTAPTYAQQAQIPTPYAQPTAGGVCTVVVDSGGQQKLVPVPAAAVAKQNAVARSQLNNVSFVIQNNHAMAAQSPVVHIEKQMSNTSYSKLKKAIPVSIVQKKHAQADGNHHAAQPQPQQQAGNNPVKTQYIITSVPAAQTNGAQPNVVVTPVSWQQQQQQDLSKQQPVVVQQQQPQPAKQAAAINRIQIASVNIPITNSQVHHFSPVTVSAKVVPSANNRTAAAPATTPGGGGQARPPRQISPRPQAEGWVLSDSLANQIITRLKVKTTPQQLRQLTKEQLQRLILQHQAVLKEGQPAVKALAAKPHSASPQVVTALQAKVFEHSGLQSQTPPPATQADSNQPLVALRVDPNLTAAQVDEVQQIIAKKIPTNKKALTAEQKQLLTVFRAHLHSMEHPVQQYYLRNPQLFIQKVHQHLQTGKPFVLHAKLPESSLPPTINSRAKTPPAGATQSTRCQFSQHPTISLSSDGKAKAAKTSPQPGGKPKPAAATPVLAAAGSKPAVKRKPEGRPASPPPKLKVEDVLEAAAVPEKKPSLIARELEKHTRMVTSPDTLTPFRSVRDAVNRLLPYHVYNSPQVPQKDFDDSEEMFAQISERCVTKMNRMFAKYHLLFLKDTVREACSADAVMLERSFLHHERALFVEAKRKIQENPSSLKDYLQPESKERHFKVASFLLEEERHHVTSEATKRDDDDTATRRDEEGHKEVLLQEAVDSIL